MAFLDKDGRLKIGEGLDQVNNLKSLFPIQPYPWLRLSYTFPTNYGYLEMCVVNSDANLSISQISSESTFSLSL